MSDEKETPQIDLEAGVVTLKKGEDVKSFKLNSEDDLGNLIKLGQRGWYFDDEASKELGDLRKVIKNWDSAIDAAKSSDDAMAQLVNKLELAVGRPLTKREEKQLEKGQKPQILLDEEEDSRLQSTIDELRSEIKQLKQSQSDFAKTSKEAQEQRMADEINKEADALEAKFDGKEGSPKFERKAVFAFASENGITNLEQAFKLMNFDKLTEHAKSQLRKEIKAEAEKRNAGFVETGDQKAELNTGKPSKAKTYNKLGQNALKDAKSEGLSLFTDN